MVRVVRPDDDGGGAFTLSVDGRRVGTLNAGDELVIYAPPGEHELAARFAWISGRLTLRLGDGERLRVTAQRAFGYGPFEPRYFTRRREAIRLTPG